jgi:hypothetical protein
VPRAALAAATACACLTIAACGGGDGGRIQRPENVQRCLSKKKLPTNLTRNARLPGSSEPADLLDTELISPSAARIYVFASVDAAKAAEGASQGGFERRDNVLVDYAEEPTAADRKALEDCFSGRF